MGLQYTLAADRTRDYLMVQSSYVSLNLDEDMDRPLCHFDYERDKVDGYPEAHMQIHAESEHWAAVLQGKPMAKLHLPVGGRRYRPTLEDIIEFLLVEELVDGRKDALQVLAASREEYRITQLRAAIRNHPQVAREVLRDLPD